MKNIRKPNKYSKYIKIPEKYLKYFPRYNPWKWKYPNFYLNIQNIFFLNLEFYLKPESITEISNPKQKKISIIPKTYLKYSNIPNILKIFNVLWMSDRVLGRIHTKLRYVDPKIYPIYTFSRTPIRSVFFIRVNA